MNFSDNAGIFWMLFAGLGATLLCYSFFSVFVNLLDPTRRQLRQLNLSEGSGQQNSSNKFVETSLLPVQRFVLPQSEKDIANAKRKLAMAGYSKEKDLLMFYFIKMSLSAVLGIGCFIYVAGGDYSGSKILLYVSLGFAVGMILPGVILEKMAETRAKKVMNGFPDMLDLLVACSEAGLGLNSAIQRVGLELDNSHPILAQELKVVGREMLAGVNRLEALKGLGNRTGIDEITSFVAMLSQSIRFGTGISETLRIYSAEFRDKRMQKAEEAAQKVGTKLMFPLVLCMFPAFFVVAVGPAALSMAKVFN